MDAQTALRNYNARLSAFSDANRKGLEKPLEVFGDVMYTFAEQLVGADLAPEVTGCWVTQYENHADGDHSKLAWAYMLQIAIDSAAEQGEFKVVKRLSQLRVKKTEKISVQPQEEEKMTKEEKRAARFENPQTSKKLNIQVPKKMFSK